MSYLSNFKRWMNKTLTLQEYTRAYNATTGVFGDYVWSDTSTTFLGCLWNKAEAESYISEQFREEVTDVFCTEVVSTIPAESRLTDGTDKWSVITRQDVARQGKVYLIGLKRL